MTDKSPQRSADSLGDPIYSHGPSRANVAAGIFIGVALIAGGVALGCSRFWEQGRGREEDWQTYAFHWLSVVLLVAGGVAVLIWMYNLIGFRLYVCGEGFYFVRRGQAHVFAWEDIVEVRETIRHEPVLPGKSIASAVAATRARRSYGIKRRDGVCFNVGVNTLPQVSLLGGPLKAAAERIGIAWHTEEIGRKR